LYKIDILPIQPYYYIPSHIEPFDYPISEPSTDVFKTPISEPSRLIAFMFVFKNPEVDYYSVLHCGLI